MNIIFALGSGQLLALFFVAYTSGLLYFLIKGYHARRPFYKLRKLGMV